jgi:Asp-tRNA(Asn)/Glu-tRNA(Gln) amidotransferase B subunit
MPDEILLDSLCREAIAANPKTVEELKSGNKSAALKVLTDQVMKGYPGTVNRVYVANMLEKLMS